ncbi:MAG: hypothetical protein AAF620_06585 [Bacteroidota bacterium]
MNLSKQFSRSDIDSLQIEENEKTLLQLMIQSDDQSELEKISYQVFMQGSERDITHNTKKIDIFLNVRKEIFKFFCTKSNIYRTQRESLKGSFKDLVLIVATAIGTSAGIAPALITGLVASLILLLSKIGINAWCETYKEEYGG